MSEQTDRLHGIIMAAAGEAYSKEEILGAKHVRAILQQALALSRIADALEESNEIKKL